MSDHVSWSIEMDVIDGRIDAARALMEEMVTATLQEAGTTRYEWFLSADMKICHILESYTNSDAAMVHLGNFGSKFAERFSACFSPTALYAYGEVSEELRAGLDGFGAVYLGSLGGFCR